MLPEDLLGDSRQIFRTVAQRRHFQGELRQPVIEVAAEFSSVHQFLKILIGRRHQSHVHADLLAAAQPKIRHVVQHPQQLDLDLQFQVPNLVQKQRSLVGDLKESRLGGVGAAERAFFVAEQLALHQMLRNRRAIHVHQRPVAAQRVIVDGVGNHFFSHARLAHNQHRLRTLRHLLRQAYHPLEGIAADNGLVRLRRFLDCYGHNRAPTSVPLGAATCLLVLVVPHLPATYLPKQPRIVLNGGY